LNFNEFVFLAAFQMMPGIPMMPHMMPRPIFPTAVASSAPPQKPTFPAYTISAPPTVGSSNTTSTSSSDNQRPIASSSATQSGTQSIKIMHPAEDLSLEEIRARKQQYKTKVNTNNNMTSTSSVVTSQQEMLKTVQSEVSDVNFIFSIT
jgi:hypothetical protein